MGVFKNVAEPAVIVALFTFGALLNRRRHGQSQRKSRMVNQFSDSDSNDLTSLKHPQPLADQAEASYNIIQRVLRRFPFLVEIAYWNLTYWPYQIARAYSAANIVGDKTVYDRATRHARQILKAEKTFGIAVERGLQQFILKSCPWLMGVLANIYYSHIVLGVGFVVYCYTYMPHRKYTCIRRTIFLDNWLAFCILSGWRCVPPRLLQDSDFVDVLHKPNHSGSAWTNNRFQLTIAAMPSLHFGTSCFIAWSLWRFSPHAPLRKLSWLWPTAMLLTILATANHWVLDAVVGVLIPVACWHVNGYLGRLPGLDTLILGRPDAEVLVLEEHEIPLEEVVDGIV